MTEKLHSIVLRTVKYGDSQLIIDLLTEERGRLSVTWRMPRSGKAKQGRNVFQPLTLCEITCDIINDRKLPLVKEAHVSQPYCSLNIDPVKISVAFFLAEFLVQVSRCEQQDSRFFKFVENSLLWYDLATEATANFHLMFLVRISRFLGFQPDVESFSNGCYFDLRTGEFCTHAPLHRDFLPVADTAQLPLLMRMNPANMDRFLFSRNERNRIIEILLHFYSLHVPGFKEMKSWDVLKEVFA